MEKKLLKIIIAFLIYIGAIILPIKFEILKIILFVISYLIVGLDILKKAFKNIIRGKVFDENFLMALATIGAFCNYFLIFVLYSY